MQTPYMAVDSKLKHFFKIIFRFKNEKIHYPIYLDIQNTFVYLALCHCNYTFVLNILCNFIFLRTRALFTPKKRYVIYIEPVAQTNHKNR